MTSSSQSKFSIPHEYADQIRVKKEMDPRTDEEILHASANPPPVTSEKNLWGFWDKGLAQMRPWQQRNVVGWVRILGPSWTVRILDKVDGSSANSKNFVPSEYLPDAYNEGTMTGHYIGQHSADLLRAPVLYLHGGVWMDVGCILFAHLDVICWNQLEDPSSPYEVSVPLWRTLGNYFIAARKENILIKKWHDVYFEIWKGRTDLVGVSSHPILKPVIETPLLQAWMVEMRKAEGVGLAVTAEAIVDYTAQISAWDRACMIQDPNDGYDGPKYWATKVLLFSAMDENLPAHVLVGWGGAEQYAVFATKLDEPDEEKRKRAEHVVWTSLTKSMQKVHHGGVTLLQPALADIWGRPENKDADRAEGTFAELLRYGSVHFEQTRTDIPRVESRPIGTVLQKGIVEA